MSLIIHIINGQRASNIKGNERTWMWLGRGSKEN